MRNNGRGSIPAIKKVTYKGIIIYLYSVGWFSYWSHMASVTLRLWERQGILPQPIFTGLGPYRWYTSRELIEYSQHITVHYQTGRDLKVLKASLHAANRNLMRLYNDLSGSTRSHYDDSYIALPRQDAHERAMQTAVAEAAEKRKDYFFKQIAPKKVGHENSKIGKTVSVENHPHQKIGLAGKSASLAQSNPEAFEKLQLHGAELRRRASMQRRRGIH